VLRAHDIGYFLYIGGNDSMDTADKIARLAQQRGLDLVAVGVPKTIDNDVGDSEFQLIDHTPGYGSTAKYWMHMVQWANEENAGSSPADPVLVLQAMGRKIGFIPAAARLADPQREMPLQIYLAERHCGLDELTDNVNDQLKRDGRCIVVISEGFNEPRDLPAAIYRARISGMPLPWPQPLISTKLTKWAGRRLRWQRQGREAGWPQSCDKAEQPMPCATTRCR
jgi:6-phosphofructokinase